MEIEDIRKAVRATIEAIAPGTDVQGISPDRPLREQIALDSMDWLNVVVALHERLAIDIPESDYGRLETLDSAVAYLASRRAELERERPRPAAPLPLPRATHRVNGTAVAIRPMRADDSPLEAAFVRHLSPDTRYERFMLTLNELSQAKLKYLTDVDQVRHVALVATVDRGGKEVLVGVARYIVDPAGTGCEFAIAVDDAWHGSGLAGILMHDLIDIARSRGLATMEGIVLATNARMLRFTRQLGFRQERDPEAFDTVRVVRSL
ncbi:MAG: GNAT family N-acetyltransferase [Betaproteobacteria bacterium]|nr:GNAT family N-acetyltransferase [Betaproteobacteria bacterium]